MKGNNNFSVRRTAMKIVKNNLFAIAFAITTIVALSTSVNTIVLSRSTGDLYVEALDSGAYQQVARAYDSSQQPVF
jgi:hypothetical protein